MPMQLIEIDAHDFRDLKRKLHPYLWKRVFHSTDKTGYEGILKQGAIVSASCAPIARKWTADSYFNEHKCVSFYDLFHPEGITVIKENIDKCCFFRHKGSETTYLFVLKEELHGRLITWKDIPKSNKLQIVPHVESGFPSPVSLENFDLIIKLNLWSEPKFPFTI